MSQPLKDIDQCAVCRDTLKDPKTLPCLHSFCSQCLLQHVQAGAPHNPACPLCRATFQLPGGEGLQSLPQLFFITNLLSSQTKEVPDPNQIRCELCDEKEAAVLCTDCVQFQCAGCQKTHSRTRGLTHHQHVDIEAGLEFLKTRPSFCGQHHDKKVEVFCQDCDIFGCSDCMQEEHLRHHTTKVADVITGFKAEIEPHVKKITERLEPLKASIAQLESMAREIEGNAVTSSEKIQQTFAAIRKELAEREDLLLKKVVEAQGSKWKEILGQKENLEMILQWKLFALNFAEMLHKNGNQVEVGMSKKLILARLQTLASLEYTMDPMQGTFLNFEDVKIEEIRQTISEIGRISTIQVSPEHSSIDQDSLATPKLNKLTTVGIVPVDSNQKPISDPLVEELFAVKLLGPSGSLIQHKLAWRDKSFGVSFTPTVKGRYSLQVQIGSRNIRGSPLSFNVLGVSGKNSSVEGFPNLIETNKEISFKIVSNQDDGNRYPEGGQNPLGRVLGADGSQSEIPFQDHADGTYTGKISFRQKGFYRLVLSLMNEEVKNSPLDVHVQDPLPPRFSRNYSLVNQQLRQFGSCGSGDGQFSTIYGLATNGNGQIVVADYSNKRIQIITPQGQFVTKIVNGLTGHPYGLALDQDSNIYVSESSTSKIHIFTWQGNLIRSISLQENGTQIPSSYPGIALDRQRNIYFPDYDGHRIFVFNQNGDFLRKFGSQGNGNGQLANPTKVVILSTGNLAVADYSNGRICEFKANGDFVKVIASGISVWDLCVDANDNILVVGWTASQVQVFSSGGTLVRSIPISIKSLSITMGVNGEIFVGGRTDAGQHLVVVY